MGKSAIVALSESDDDVVEIIAEKMDVRDTAGALEIGGNAEGGGGEVGNEDGRRAVEEKQEVIEGLVQRFSKNENNQEHICLSCYSYSRARRLPVHRSWRCCDCCEQDELAERSEKWSEWFS